MLMYLLMCVCVCVLGMNASLVVVVNIPVNSNAFFVAKANDERGSLSCSKVNANM